MCIRDRRTRIGEEFYDPETARYATGSQIDQIYPMLAGVTASEEVPKVTQRLFRETRERLGGHIGCGLVGVTAVSYTNLISGRSERPEARCRSNWSRRR